MMAAPPGTGREWRSPEWVPASAGWLMRGGRDLKIGNEMPVRIVDGPGRAWGLVWRDTLKRRSPGFRCWKPGLAACWLVMSRRTTTVILW